MFGLQLNELRATIHLRPQAPLLVKDGRHRADDDKERWQVHSGVHVRRSPNDNYIEPGGALNMAFVHSTTPDGDRFYLPGSSLRGVLRAASERLVGRWQPGWVRASQPFENVAAEWVRTERAYADERQGAGPDAAAIYRRAGPIERCFGHTALRGRWIIADAWMPDEERQQPQVMLRDGVGIDRKTGAARENIKYQYETLVSGTFKTTITLVNYELWQLGLLAHLLAALDEGEVRVGYGERRGLGQVRVAVDALEFRWYGAPPSQSNGQVVLPSLQERAEAAGITDYEFRDKNLSPTITLTPIEKSKERLLGHMFICKPAIIEREGISTTDWNAAPWPTLGRLLPQALRDWPPEEVQP